MQCFALGIEMKILLWSRLLGRENKRLQWKARPRLLGRGNAPINKSFIIINYIFLQ